MRRDDEKTEEEGMGTEGEIRRDPGALQRGPRPQSGFLARLRDLFLSYRPTEEQEGAIPAPRDDDVSPEPGYGVYGEFIKDELDAQDRRKASFEQRGLAVITTSGALVTLLFALAALSTKEAATFTLPGAARTWLSVALVLFFLSAVAALLTNAPFIYQAVTAARIRERLREKPPRDAQAAARDVAFTRLDSLASAKKINGIKGWALAIAMLFEALAVGCVAVAIWNIL